MKQIIVVDDHAILRKGLIQLLKADFKDYKFLEASNGSEAVSILRKEEVVAVLMDIQMPKMDGIEVMKQMSSLGIKVPVVILSMQPEDQYALRAFRAGASGFLKKNSSPDEVASALRKVMSGKKHISDTVAHLLLNNVTNKDSDNLLDRLSDREIQVLQELASGKTISNIAAEIGLSVNTISTYRSRILEKLSLKNNSAIIRFAIENDLI